jgi:Domain of unknown function (DUF4399)
MNFSAVFAGLTLTLFLLLTTGKAIAVDLVSHAPRSAQAYIIEPADGAIVSETFKVQFGLSGMDLAPAGMDQPNTGHHHLLIDQPELPELTASLPATEQIRHFGKAQTETDLTLEPGEHTLRLVLGNYLHVPHDNPVISEPTTVTVQ